MTEAQVKARLAAADASWDHFIKWMRGQTMGIYPDGSTNFYDHDVERFIWYAARGEKEPWWLWD